MQITHISSAQTNFYVIQANLRSAGSYQISYVEQ